MKIAVTGKLLTGIFLLLNLAAGLSVLCANGLDVVALLLVSGVFFVLLRYWHRLMGLFIQVLAVTFPLYCYQSYTENAHVFEFLLAFSGLSLLSRMWPGRGARRLNAGLLVLCALPVLLAVLSIALFPLSSFLRLFSLWGWADFSSAVLSATPENPLYALAAANRLLLFFCLIVLLSLQDDARALYRHLFLGAAIGALLAVLLGLLNQFAFIDLAWLRVQFLDPSGVPRLHSVTGNPGWFAQYLLVCLPLVLLLFPLRKHFGLGIVGIGVSFSLAALALLLTASRTSWLLFPPVVLLILLSMLPHRCRRGEAIWWPNRRTVMRGGTILVLVTLLVTGGAYTLVDQRNAPTGGPLGPRAAYIMQRLRHILSPGERIKVWRESLVLASESPVFGLGYGGYKWHQQVMMTIPDSRFRYSRQASANWDTPHNFFLQLVIDNGLVGLLLWLLPIGASAALLWHGFRKEDDRTAQAALISLIAALFYGLTQALQYIPLIWFLFFLFIGYAATIRKSVFPWRLRQAGPWLLVVLFFLVCCGGWFYLANAQSRQLAARYGLSRYVMDRGEIGYSGFYPREDWGADGLYRWSGRRAEIVFHRGGVFKLIFACNAPNLYSDPLVLDITLDGQPLDRYTFWRAGRTTRTYWLPNPGEDGSVIRLAVSKTWNPRAVGLGKDARNLGVAVSEPCLLGDRLKETIGFFPAQPARDEAGRLLMCRWAGASAVFAAPVDPGLPHLLLKAGRPYLERSPQVVRFVQNQVTVAEVRLADEHWTEVSLPDTLSRDLPLRLIVDRTWNPRRRGYGDDGRDLGVWVARPGQATRPGPGR